MATHVAERGRSEVQPLAPVARVICIFEERARRRYAQPVIPVEASWHRVGRGRELRRIPPLLLTPGVDLFHLPDRAARNESEFPSALAASCHSPSSSGCGPPGYRAPGVSARIPAARRASRRLPA